MSTFLAPRAKTPRREALRGRGAASYSIIPQDAALIILKEPDEGIEQLLGLAVQTGLPMVICADALRVGQVRQREDINIPHIIALKLRREHIPEQL